MMLLLPLWLLAALELQLTTAESSFSTIRLGCFADAAVRDLKLEHRGWHQVSKRYCLSYCSSRGYRYVGLQGSQWCFCGDSYGLYRRVGDVECNRRCAGNSSETCGGNWRNEVFTTGVEDWEGKVTPLGCFADRATSRDLQLMHRADSRTSKHFCWDFCQSRGYRYFGMQNRIWCACGNSHGRHGQVDSRQCNRQCPIDARATCGGRLRTEIFTTGIENWEVNSTRLGCFKDSSQRDLPLVHTAGSQASRQFCWHYCRSRGYKYFGLQAPAHCTCGNSYGRYGRVDNSQCQIGCRGESGATCGGYMRNEVFTTGVEDWQNGVHHMGCFVDSSTRDLELMHYMGDITNKYACWKLCRSRGYSYFALQLSWWCFCGNWFGRYRHVSTTECDHRCAGDSTQICGGEWRNNVYSTGIEDSAGHLVRIGCFKDRSDHDLPVTHRSGEVTTKEFCWHYCKARGHGFFSLQARVRCMCGDAYGRHGRVRDSQCNVQCGGDQGSTCGAAWKNEVFATGADDWERGVFRLGCFVDSSHRDLPLVHDAGFLISRRYCWSYCRSRGYKYFGLQAGSACTCGNTFGRYGQVRDTECSSRCHEHTSPTSCGGSWRNEVFTTGLEPWDDDVSRVGCFKDSWARRDLPLVFNAGMRARRQLCWHHCHSRGYKYFGLQHKQYCSCGNSYGRYGQVNDTECSDTCLGDTGETCGAEMRNEIFTTGVEDWETGIIKLGCFEDRGDRDLRVVHHAGKLTSKYYCWKYCRSKNYRYFGMQSAAYCTCGNSYGRYKRLDNEECNHICLGDSTITCGAQMKNELFTTGVDHWERKVTRIGCFKDKVDDRDLPVGHRGGRLTTKHFCWNFCRSRGYKYFGLQAREFCYCGNSYGRHGRAVDSQCSQGCLGDPSTNCGAELMSDIFDTGAEAWEQRISRLGCYKDTSDRDLPLKHNAGNLLTKKFCWDFCRSRGYKYFGLQNRRFCFCGNSYGKHGQVEDEECHQRCRGDASTTCGAEWRNEVYETGVGNWEHGVNYRGCFADTVQRDLPMVQLMGDGASKYYCWSLCNSLGYKYFGLQAAAWCFCGNSFGRYGRVNDGDCSQKCKGDSTVLCGGAMKSRVFTTGAADWENGNSSRLGCFRDEAASRDLATIHQAGRMASKFYCWSHCSSRGYDFFALQASQWCACGNSYGRHGRSEDADCGERCLGDPVATCGGHLRNEVFSVGLRSDTAVN